MKKNITPLPWQASHNTGPNMQGYSQSSCIVGIGGQQLQIIAGCFSDIGGKDVAEANAEFIAKACNSHDELAKQLRWTLGFIETYASEHMGPATPEFIKARAVLAKAEAK